MEVSFSDLLDFFIRRKAIYLKDIEEYAVLIFIVQDDKLRTIETRLQSALEGGNLSIWELDIVRETNTIATAAGTKCWDTRKVSSPLGRTYGKR